jgi:hypothetical protein
MEKGVRTKTGLPKGRPVLVCVTEDLGRATAQADEYLSLVGQGLGGLCDGVATNERCRSHTGPIPQTHPLLGSFDIVRVDGGA